MSVIRFDTTCIGCILNKFLGHIPPSVDEAVKLKFAKLILKIMAEADDTVSAPEIVAEVTRLKNETFGFSDDYADIKVHFNRLMLSKEPKAAEIISKADEPLKTAAKFALLGNYIDFGAMDSVSEQKLDEMLENSGRINLDETEFSRLKAELSTAKNLVYLTDNCGEVVLDKLFIRELKKAFPKLQITVLVRGEPVLNDATIEDANEVGLTEITKVLPNGTNIAGTCYNNLSAEAKVELDKADVIISKGQGNFETLHDCGRNVYYFFLCKCRLFSTRFNVAPLTAMLLNDRRMK